MQDAVVVLGVDVAVVVEGVVGYERRTHLDGGIHACKGADGVSESIALHLERLDGTLADVDEVTAGEIGAADARNDVAGELNRRYGTCYVHVEQTILEGGHLGIAERERSHLNGGVGHLEGIVH